MKPVMLHLTAFGSFPGTETIDFAALSAHGLFVVSGATGSGKTTVFDAMTFALYGTVPGDRLDHIRSHHATGAAVTGVDLTFDTSEGRFCVRRTAKYDRPKQRGQGMTTVQPTAALYRVVADGSPGGALEPVAGRPQEVNTRCEELVGLTAQQFQRVVLLPQGKCAEFLMAETASRRGLLQQLFGTQLFERATNMAREQAAALRAQVDGRVGEVERHRRNGATNVAVLRAQIAVEHHLGVDDLSVCDIELAIDALTPLIHQHRAATEAAAIIADQLRSRHDTAVTDARQWDKRVELVRVTTALDAERPSVEADDERRAAAERAAHVVKAAAERDLAESRRRHTSEAAGQRRRRLLAEAGDAGIEFGDDRVAMGMALADLAAQLATRKAAVSAQLADAERLAEAETTARVLGQTAAAATEVLAMLDAETERLSGELHSINEQLDTLSLVARTIGDRSADAKAVGGIIAMRHELSELESHAHVANVAADDADATLSSLTAGFLASVAPQLAESLVAGNPCPVCGSAEHPFPAHRRVADAVTRDQVETAKLRRDQLSTSLHEVLGRLEERRRQLGEHLTVDMAVLESNHDLARVALDEAREAETVVLRLDVERARIDKLVAQCGAQLPACRSAHLSAEANLAAASAHAAALREQLGQFDTVRLAEELDLVGRAEVSAAALDTLERERAGAEGAAALAASQLTTALDDHGFVDLDAAMSVALPDEETGAIERRVTQWHAAHSDAQTRLAALDDDSDLPEQRPDVDALAAEVARVNTAAVETARRQNILDVRLEDATSAIDSARRVHEAAASLRADYETATTVFAVCNGDNTPRVQLETWVLAGELDRVTAAANVHLARMTGHRYSLQRHEPTGLGNRRSGLDLVVDDADTGRSRPPSTLSGGEQFQASLALALGLADVVSQGGSGSGKVYEALFIDEGFGSLDADALDEAVDALADLRSTGRMVGVITHIDTMKRQLPIGIDVIKRPTGGSTINQPLL